MSTTSFRFNTATDTPYAAQLLVFLAEHANPGARNFIEYQRLGGPGPSDPKKLDTCTFMLGDGKHTVRYKDTEFSVTVNPLVAGSKLLNFDAGRTAIHGKEISIDGVQDPAFVRELIFEASAFVNDLFYKQTPAQYVFEARYSGFRRVQSIVPRTALFLKKGEHQRLFDTVASFLGGRDEYARFNVPYKLNIMLHGLPGTGKTSAISAIASHFGMSLAFVPFSTRLDDDTLPNAMHSANAIGCRMIALEDIDSFLTREKSTLTLSGLLNSLDGLMRGEGLIVVLTANSLEKIDCEALLRTARIDFALEFTHADEFQTRAAFDYYFPMLTSIRNPAEEEWARLWSVAKTLQYPAAALQQFFFRARGKASLPVDEFRELAKGLGAQQKAEFYS